MRILIAGCGDVGIALASRLVTTGHDVIALRRKAVEPSPASDLHWIYADLCDSNSLEQLPSDIDAVVYMAAADRRTPEAYRDAYVKGVDVLLSRLRDLELKSSNSETGASARCHFIFVSSTGVYGEDNGELVDEETPTRPRNFTGELLLEGEALVRNASFPSTVVRFGGIYGPGRNWLLSKVRSKEAEILRNSKIYTNRIHRDDCAKVLEFLLEQGAIDNQVYIAVDDAPVDRSVVYEFLAGELGVELRVGDSGDVLGGALSCSGKRCSNQKLKDRGYSFIFPSYVEGYRSILNE
jgi:nucleoside-diphosphate-sugar epimerase